MKTDSLFYRLFQERPELVFELAEMPLPADAAYTLHAEEVKQTSFRLDGLLLPPEERLDLPLVFIETQFQPDPDFYGRWFTELLLYLYRQRSHRDWRAVAIFPNHSADTGVQTPYRPLLEHAWVKRVYLDDRELPVGVLDSQKITVESHPVTP